jgi:thiamine-phosphate diphosphorylase
MSAAGFDLLLIADPQTPGWLDVILGATDAAPPARLAIQLRAPGVGSGAMLEHARAMALAVAGRATLLVNDRADVARAAGCGVHLRESSLEVADARSIVGEGAAVGASVHDEIGIDRRCAADYLVLAPFGEVPGKGGPLGAERFAELARRAVPPVLALGGIETANVAAAIAAGAKGVAVQRAIFGASDPRAATAQLFAALDAARGI